ncbi:alpha/beta fold hydrolase [Aequorivita ciconiae]|uniref:alpha/beta fold hydrolase n=1 Tax=Aequorivita ciconiae TaxID=2494375 RepID=UPI0013E3E633|nr:alpha/beta fold hydrolase [Aequorivita sp. H23M31]
MNFNLKKELPLLLLSVLPISFMGYIWKALPNEVPLHWNLQGEIDRYGSKGELFIIGLLPIFLYALFLFIPLIDPKKRMEAMGNKFYAIRLITGLFIAVLFTFILYSVKEQSLGNPNYLFMIIGAFFVLLGNYFRTIKPNYFVGIRTPWTLENEDVWKSTHRLAGKLWVGGGLVIIISCFIFDQETALTIFYIFTGIIVLVPVVYSYIKFKKSVALIILITLSTGIYSQNNRPQTPEPPFNYKVENVSFFNIKDSVTLAGTFTYPESGSNFPAVILITGSGPQDRNEEIFNHKPFWVIADYLSNKGIAVLRYDDRGVGGSTGDFATSTTFDFGQDVVAAIDYLKTRKEINLEKIGLIGHSEGGIIAPIIAAKNSDVAFVVSLAGVMIPMGDLLILQKEMQLRTMGSSEEYIVKEIDFDTGIMATIQKSTAGSLKEDLEKYTIQYFLDNPKFVSEHGLSEAYYKQLIVNSYSSPWLSSLIRYNPTAALENLDVPLLALNGEKDLQVPAKENFEALRDIAQKFPSKRFTLNSYPNLNHLFQECEKGTVQEYGQIEQTFSPAVLHDISEWINKI